MGVRLARQLTESFRLWMKFDFATVQFGGFTAPGLPLARCTEFFQLRILGQSSPALSEA